MPDVLQYYSEPGDITDLSGHKPFIEWLGDDPGAIYQVVQGLLVHDLWVGFYGENYNEAHEYSQQTAYMVDLLDKAIELDKSNLAIPRRPGSRVIGCCREFATLMCAMLRAKGIPARSRCGFAVYFGWDGKYEDHWICEYWNGQRWVMADPQLDPFQQSSVINWGLNSGNKTDKDVQRIKQFTPRDLKPDEFITAGRAWKMCREEKADPEDFGIACPIKPEWGIDSLYGLWFVRGQLLRDFAALNKVETVPYLVRICKGLDWKPWRFVHAKDNELTEEDLSLLDIIAELSNDADGNYARIREAYLNNGDLSVPYEITMR
ncbi:MAG: transglutaminase-like domain-containing protein [Pseudomonadota bacterium]